MRFGQISGMIIVTSKKLFTPQLLSNKQMPLTLLVSLYYNLEKLEAALMTFRKIFTALNIIAINFLGFQLFPIQADGRIPFKQNELIIKARKATKTWAGSNLQM